MFAYCNRYKHLLRVTFLLTMVFIFTTFIVHAQNEPGNTDTLPREELSAKPDSLIENQEYPEKVEERQALFIKKSEFSVNGDSLLVRNIPGKVVQELKNDPDFWYADYEFKPVEKKNSGAQQQPAQMEWVEVLLWFIIIGGFAGFIMWYLANSNIGLFRKKSIMIDTGEEETETRDIFSIQYRMEIEKAVANSNYRFAVRLMYLQLLKDLSERNIILYKLEKTNFEYLLQLVSTKFHHDFFRVTRSYEYCWYGQFEINADAYQVIKNDFKNLEQKLSVI